MIMTTYFLPPFQITGGSSGARLFKFQFYYKQAAPPEHNYQKISSNVGPFKKKILVI